MGKPANEKPQSLNRFFFGGCFAILAFSLVAASIVCLLIWEVAWAASETTKTAEMVENMRADRIAKETSATCLQLNDHDRIGCLIDNAMNLREWEVSERGLIAQQQIAKYSLWAVLTALFGTLVGVVTIYFLFGNLREARAMTTHTQEFGEASNRAYLAIEDAEIHAQDRTLHFKIRNYGCSPALKVSVKTTILDGEPFDHQVSIVDPHAERIGIYLAEQDLPGALNKDVQVKFHTKYEDVFKNKTERVSEYAIGALEKGPTLKLFILPGKDMLIEPQKP